MYVSCTANALIDIKREINWWKNGVQEEGGMDATRILNCILSRWNKWTAFSAAFHLNCYFFSRDSTSLKFRSIRSLTD